MNINKATKIPIEQVLYWMGVYPQRISGFDIWYINPFNDEKKVTFKINTKLNKWYCYSSGFGGNIVDFIIRKSGCCVTDALIYLNDFDFFLYFHNHNFKSNDNIIDYIEKIKPVNHIGLILYLYSRGITKYKSISYLKEIHCFISYKKYFALGFRNDNGGFEVVTKHANICLGIKDITCIDNGSITIRVFEDFFDYLSWKEIETEISNYMILNSVSLLEKDLKYLNAFSKIELFLKNNFRGNEITLFLMKSFENVIDCRSLYINYKNLNEYLINQLGSGDKNN